MRSLLSSANVGLSQMLLAALPKSAVHQSTNPAEDTLVQLWRILKWSLDHMYYGKFPEMNHQGKPWPAKSKRGEVAGSQLHSQGLCGMIFSITADGEFHQNHFGLPGASHNDCCWSCGANKSTHPHNDYRAEAKWRTTLKDHTVKSPTEHIITTVPGVNGYSFAYDSLHILELGVSSHILANIMFDLVVKGEIHESTQEARLKTLFRKLLEQYQEQGVDASHQVRRLQLSTFCQPKAKYSSFPDLTGIKGREVRHMVGPFVEICKDFNDGTPYKKHRMLCISNLSKMYECLEGQGLHPSTKAYQSFKKNTDLCLVHYSKLAKLAMSEGLLQWNTVHKHHLACHMPDQFQFLNCRFVATYTGETMVGFIANLAHACLNGTKPHLVPAKVAWRYRLGMHLRCAHGDFGVLNSDDED